MGAITFDVTYFWFNLLEGFFWLLLAGGCALGARRFRSTAYARLGWFASSVLFLFGISDFVEIRTNGFIGHDTWLLVWKGLCVCALVYAFAWYVRLRTRGESLAKG